LKSDESPSQIPKSRNPVAGGIKNGAYWGHLEYHDHGTGLNVPEAAASNVLNPLSSSR